MKTELVVTAHSYDHIQHLLDAGADAIVVGESRFGLRLPGEFSIEEIKQASTLVRTSGKKLYVAVNAIFHNEHIEELEAYMTTLQSFSIDRLIFGDPAVIQINRQLDEPFELTWNAETTATNWFTANYWGKRGAKRAVLARELNLDEILEMKEHATVELEVQVHGMTCMFQSKRALIGNYFMYLQQAMKIEPQHSTGMMSLYDKERDQYYPILEDSNGTHIFSPRDICLVEELSELLEAGVDAFKIDGILHEEAYVTEVTKRYRQAIDAYYQSAETYEEIKENLADQLNEIQPRHRKMDTGFLWKETVY
ncbi:peptidase U32 family protein [Paenisporosarcina cavernae]|uniref:U32 family peptidase n=1 Tax=Paenisporosarcina cavernae TaxID=2320858 RepID=A0A385YVZ7_9BACL|nr:peptidase U32 family protein [Paenisporosarcina cavernae]AYC29703.1 U32 family peptidase [Paenisporosarcina cavernae]